jgi:hypothetical protein
VSPPSELADQGRRRTNIAAVPGTTELACKALLVRSSCTKSTVRFFFFPSDGLILKSIDGRRRGYSHRARDLTSSAWTTWRSSRPPPSSPPPPAAAAVRPRTRAAVILTVYYRGVANERAEMSCRWCDLAGAARPPLLLVGHRGKGMNARPSGDVRENTLRSFNDAATCPGVHYVEFDVQVRA